jgi:hypothetical protein
MGRIERKRTQSRPPAHWEADECPTDQGSLQWQQQGAGRKPTPTQCERLDYGLSFVRRPTCFTAQVFNIRQQCIENGAFGAWADG